MLRLLFHNLLVIQLRSIIIGSKISVLKDQLTIIKREADICLASNPDYGNEVFKIKHRKTTVLPNGTISEPGEYPLSTSEWGKNAFTWLPKYRDLAVKDFNKLVRKYSDIALEILAKG